jgi:hypothetical protein
MARFTAEPIGPCIKGKPGGGPWAVGPHNLTGDEGASPGSACPGYRAESADGISFQHLLARTASTGKDFNGPADISGHRHFEAIVAVPCNEFV